MGTPAIRTEGLSKRYGSADALIGLDLEVEQGEVVVYLGPNGAGKTTTIRLLLGLARPTAGRAEIFGLDCQRQAVEAHRRLAYVPGEASLWPSLTGFETIHLLGRVQGRVDTAYRDEQYLLFVALGVSPHFLGRVQIEALDQLVAVRGVDPALDPSQEMNRLEPGERGPQAGLAGDVSEPPVCLDGLALAVEPEDLCPPRRRPGQPQEQADGGRLPGTVRPQVTDDLARGDLEVEADQRIGRTVALGQTLGADGRSTHESNFHSSREPGKRGEPQQPSAGSQSGEPRDVATFCCDNVIVARASQERNWELQ